MSYYQTLGLLREPFSTSPDPELLYRSKNHLECLQHMEIAVRLRRGLNVVIGEVGTGKTTLGRELMRILGQDPDIEVFFLDDPYFPDTEGFLAALARLFGLDVAGCGRDLGRLKETIKAALAHRGGDGRRIVTLIVDEGQKITGDCLEMLRELLNFETNTHKLLQIVLFAQREFDDVLAARPNLDDRVNFRYELRPLGREQTRRMIEARLDLCAPDGKAPRLFTDLAHRRIHRLTGGYPRKIVRLCHFAMLKAVGEGRRRVSWSQVGRAARDMRGSGPGIWWRRMALAGALGALVGALVINGLGFDFASLPSRPVAPVAARDVAADRVTVPDRPGSEMRAQAVVPPARDEAAPAQPEARSRLASAHDAPAAPARSAVSLPESPAAFEIPEIAAVAAAAEPLPAGGQATAALAAPAVETANPVASGPAREENTQKAVPAPAVLGEAKARQGVTISRQALWVYGVPGGSVLARMAKANPDLDIGRVRAGQSIVFPAIETSPPPAGARILSLGTVDSLEQGMARIQEATGTPPLTLFATREPGKGVSLQLVVYSLYGDGPTADAVLASLPPELAAKARLVTHFPKGTVFYTDLKPSVAKRAPAKSVAQTPRRSQVAASEVSGGPLAGKP